MELLGKDNKALSTEGVDPKVIALITGAFEGLTGQVASAVTAGIDPVVKSIAAMNETITNLPAPKGEENPAGEVKPGDAAGTDNAVLQAITKLSERMDKADADTASASEKSSSLKITDAYFEKNHPTMKGKQVLIKRIASANPKDDDAVKALLEVQRTEMNALMGEDQVTKMFSADVTSEGGKPGDTDDDQAEAKAKIQAMEDKLKQRA